MRHFDHHPTSNFLDMKHTTASKVQVHILPSHSSDLTLFHAHESDIIKCVSPLRVFYEYGRKLYRSGTESKSLFAKNYLTLLRKRKLKLHHATPQSIYQSLFKSYFKKFDFIIYSTFLINCIYILLSKNVTYIIVIIIILRQN